jgi:hypothetical protein
MLLVVALGLVLVVCCWWVGDLDFATNALAAAKPCSRRKVRTDASATLSAASLLSQIRVKLLPLYEQPDQSQPGHPNIALLLDAVHA